jgi:guanine nucleotide-binding protein subunit alpha
MCMGGGSDGDADAKRSREIERLIRQDEKRMSKEVKLLLLGECWLLLRQLSASHRSCD